MADNKKVSISLSSLPPMTTDNKYLVRYRIVSDDKNRTSQWSPTYKISVPYITHAVTGISASGTIVTYTTATNHNLVVGDIVSISDTDPTKYSYIDVTVVAPVTSNTFSIASTDTGSYVSGGRVNRGTEIRKSVSVSSKTATLSWTLPSTIYNKSFDVYIRTMTGSPGVWGEYKYYKTVTEGSCTYIASSLESKVQFLVQVSTEPQAVTAGAVVFYSAEHNI